MAHSPVTPGEGFGVREPGSEWFRNLTSEGSTWAPEAGTHAAFLCTLASFTTLHAHRRLQCPVSPLQGKILVQSSQFCSSPVPCLRGSWRRVGRNLGTADKLLSTDTSARLPRTGASSSRGSCWWGWGGLCRAEAERRAKGHEAAGKQGARTHPLLAWLSTARGSLRLGHLPRPGLSTCIHAS